MTNSRTIVGVTLGFLIGACGVEPDLGELPEAEDGLVISYADERRITGTYGEAGRGIDFEIDHASDFTLVEVGVRSQRLLESAFHESSAITTVLDRLTFVRTVAGIETIGDRAALDDMFAVPEAALLEPLQIALRRHGIVEEIVTLP
jgi:hypothetical protein